MTALVEAIEVHKRYGDFVAIDGVCLAIADAELVSIVGPNGAGKTTLVNLLTGLLAPTSGRVRFKGEDIAGVGPVQLARRGMARAFQLVHVFPSMTVAECIAVAVVSQRGNALRFFAPVRSDPAIIARVREVAEIFGLERKLGTESRLLSQGEKKLLDIASAFALSPEVILLDEPTSGVSSADKHGLMRNVIDAAKKAGVKAILLVEHDMDLVAEYSTRIVAIQAGKVLADRAPADFFGDPEIVAAIVGKRMGRFGQGHALMLRIDDLAVSIQGSLILRGISLRVAAGELVCLVGRNGAGKTTTFRTIMGYQRPVSGAVHFKQLALVGLATHRIAQAGVGYSPEESQVFADLTVAENIELPTWTRASSRSARERIDLAYEIFPKLRQYASRGGDQLSGGERKMVSIARALAMDPELLLLDEPFEGLSPAIIPVITEGIASIRRLGHGVLMAESNVHHIPEYADRLYVLERGEIIYEGRPGEAYPPEVMKVITGSA